MTDLISQEKRNCLETYTIISAYISKVTRICFALSEIV